MAAELRHRRTYKEEIKDEHKELLSIMSSLYKDAIEQKIEQIDTIQANIVSIQMDQTLSTNTKDILITREKEKVFKIAESLLDVFNQARDGIIQSRTTIRQMGMIDHIKDWVGRSIRYGSMKLSQLVNYITVLFGAIAFTGTTAGIMASGIEVSIMDIAMGLPSEAEFATTIGGFVGVFTGGVTYALLTKIVDTLDTFPVVDRTDDIQHTIEALNNGYKSLLQMIDNVAATKDCLICGEPFSRVDPKVFLPCGHSFHNQCISNWIVTKESSGRHAKCPSNCDGRIRLNSILTSPENVPIQKLKHSGYMRF